MLPSLLAKGSRELISQWLEEEGKGSPLAGLDKCLDRHARHEAERPGFSNLFLRHTDPHRVPALPRARIGAELGGHYLDRSPQFRRGRLAERSKPQSRRLSDMQLVDIGGSHTGLDHPCVLDRNDLEDGLTGRNDAAYRMHGEFVNDPRLRRDNVAASQCVLRRDSQPLRSIRLVKILRYGVIALLRWAMP